MDEGVAWWPVLKKWNEPNKARTTGPMGEDVREVRSRISRSDRICHVMIERAPAPIGFLHKESAEEDIGYEEEVAGSVGVGKTVNGNCRSSWVG